MTRILLWTAFLLALPVTVVGLRLGGNWLTVVPALLTAVALISRRGARGLVVSCVVTIVYSVVLMISLSIGAYWIPSFIALTFALGFQTRDVLKERSEARRDGTPRLNV